MLRLLPIEVNKINLRCQALLNFLWPFNSFCSSNFSPSYEKKALKESTLFILDFFLVFCCFFLLGQKNRVLIKKFLVPDITVKLEVLNRKLRIPLISAFFRTNALSGFPVVSYYFFFFVLFFYLFYYSTFFTIVKSGWNLNNNNNNNKDSLHTYLHYCFVRLRKLWAFVFLFSPFIFFLFCISVFYFFLCVTQ